MEPIPLEVLSPGIFRAPSDAEPVADGDYGFVKSEHAKYPPILIIAVTNVCDMACVHCAHPIIKKDPDYKGTFMDPATDPFKSTPFQQARTKDHPAEKA